MSKRAFKIALFACVVCATPLSAQQPAPAPSPLDAVPEKMPFDIPYGSPIGVERARQLVAAATAECMKRGWKMNIAVADSGANLVAFERMDGALLASIEIAMHKARTSVKFRRDIKIFENAVQSGVLGPLSLDDVIVSRGGIPLVENGSLIGAIGVSGGTGSQDEVIAKAAIAAVMK